MTVRTLAHIIESIPTSDGAGVRLRRSLGQRQGLWLDPFLMLDEFGTDKPEDYISGFPDHPHRGFETVTYMLDGHMRYQDHLGHSGDLKAGGVQWMSAGRGIVHSEMPLQNERRMRDFQLWINLPATEKKKPETYRDIQPDEIPVADLGGGTRVRVKIIASSFMRDGETTPGPIQGLTTDPTFLDVALPACAPFSQPVHPDCTAFLYAYEGIGTADKVGRLTDPGGRTAFRRRQSRSLSRLRRYALHPPRRPAPQQIRRAIRPIRNEYTRGNQPGHPRLPDRSPRHACLS